MAQSARRSLACLTAKRPKHLALLALLAVYLAVTLTYGLLNPLGEAPDEIAHMDLIRFIGEEGHLPRNYDERHAAGYKSAWPMLYHTLIGVATSWIDYDGSPRLKVSTASPRYSLIYDGLPPFVLIHTDDEAFPYQGIVLTGHLARLASTLFSAGTLVVIYLIALTVRPDDHRLALGTTAVIAAIPQFHFIASVTNDDNLLGLLSAIFTLTLLKIWQQPERHWAYVWLGLLLGLALTTKYSVALLPLLVVVVLASAVRRRALDWRAAAGRLLLFVVPLAAATAWWFIYVEQNFNQVRELGLVAGLIKPLMSTGGSDPSTQLVASFLTGGAIEASHPLRLANATIWNWAIYLFRSFWFVEGQANTTVVTMLSLAFLGLCSLTITGLWQAARQHHKDLPWPTLSLLALQIGLLLPFPLLRFYLILNPAETGQGRHILFPATAAVGLLLIWGVAAWFPPHYRHFVGLGLAGILLTISLVSFFGFVLPAFPPRLPVRTSANAREGIPNPAHIPLGSGIELIGYEVGEANQYNALPVNTVWHSLAYADQDYLIELSLLDDRNEIRSLWLGHPVDGRYPTRAWDPGDIVHDTAWLPLTGAEAGDYELRLRLRPSLESAPDRSEGANPPLSEEVGLLLAKVRLPSPSSPTPTLLPPGESVGYSPIVWQAGQPTTSAPVYGFRAAIPITLRHQDSKPAVFLVGPDGVGHTPHAQTGDLYLFLVDAHWRSGEYRLQMQGAPEETESEPLLRVQVRHRNFDVPPMSSEVHANFGDKMILLGYDFPERRTQPGGALPITLYWQAQRPMDRHYIVSNHLLNGTDMHQWGGRDRVPQDYYSTVLWTPGEVVRDEYIVPVHPSAPPGVYRLDIGLYVELAGQRWHLPLMQDGTELNTDSVTIAPIKVGGPPPGATVQNPAPQHLRADNLAGYVTLLGYDTSLEPGELHLTLYWRCETPLPADYTTFVHVRDTTGQATGQPGSILAQMDRPPAEGTYPTSLWETGEVIRDSVRIPLPSGVPAGKYEVIVGLYSFVNGERLPVLNENGVTTSDHIRLEKEISVQ